MINIENKALTKEERLEIEKIVINKEKQKQTANLKIQLVRLSEDIIQSQVGEFVPNIEEKKKQFIKLHNKLRMLEGKEKRDLINNI